MDKVVFVLTEESAIIPEYQSAYAAGCDVHANFNIKPDIKCGAFFSPALKELTIQPGGRVLVKTGLKIEIPLGYEVQVRCRSGLALKQGLILANGIGTIDSDYRGDVGVIVINAGDKPIVINHEDRIAQLVLNKVERIVWQEVDELEPTPRGDGGFGSSGI